MAAKNLFVGPNLRIFRSTSLLSSNLLFKILNHQKTDSNSEISTNQSTYKVEKKNYSLDVKTAKMQNWDKKLE